MRQSIYIFLFSSILFISCTGNKQLENKLILAEQIMSTVPDSALHILSGIKQSELPNNHIAARYALLYTQAQEKCSIQPKNDSLIRYAWRYYKKRPQELHNQCKALYYWGHIKLQQDEKLKALRLFWQIEEKLQEIDDPYYLGRLYQCIGEIYYTEMNYIPAHNFFKDAYDLFIRSDSNPEKAETLLLMAATALRMQDMERAGHYCSMALELSDQLCDQQLIRKSLAYNALFHTLSDGHLISNSLFCRIEQSVHEDTLSTDYRTLACIRHLGNDPDSALGYLQLAESYSSDIHELPVLLYLNFLVNTQAGNFRKAADNLRRYIHLSDSLTRSTLHTSIGTAERAYLRTRTAFIRYRMQNRIWWEITGGIIVIFILGIGGLCMRQHIRIQRMRTEHYLLLAEEAQAEYQLLTQKINQQHDIEKNLKSLLASRFLFIEEVGKIYYERGNPSSQQSAIFRQVKQIISDFSENGKMLEELEQMINTIHDNVMKKLRSDFPSMKQSDYQLLCYIFGSFSPQVISLFIQESVVNVYARKSRLKIRIKKSESLNKSLFLSLLE